jgi:hypothetical protein
VVSFCALSPRSASKPRPKPFFLIATMMFLLFLGFTFA